MHFEQLVDFLDLGARAARDAPLALGVEHLRVAPLMGRHGGDDGLLALQHAVIETGGGDLLLHLADLRQHTQHARHAADALHLRELLRQVLQVEDALLHLGGDGLGLHHIDGLRRLLDQRHDIAHAEDAAGYAARMEVLERVPFLADADEFDGPAGDGTHGEGRATPTITVHTGEHDAGDTDFLLEALGEVDGVLTGQAIGNEERLVGTGDVADRCRLRHQFFVDVGAAGGIQHHHVVAAQPCRLECAARDLLRILPGDDGKRIHARLPPEHRELLLRGRTARVERGHQHLAPVAVGQPVGDLGAGRRLAGALQTDEEDRDRRRCGKVDGLRLRAKHGDQLVMHNLDHHLAGLDGLQHRLADGLLAHRVGEAADHVERNIRLDQGAPHLPHGFAHIALAERTAAGELVEDAGETVREGFEHRGGFLGLSFLQSSRACRGSKMRFIGRLDQTRPPLVRAQTQRQRAHPSSGLPAGVGTRLEKLGPDLRFPHGQTQAAPAGASR